MSGIIFSNIGNYSFITHLKKTFTRYQNYLNFFYFGYPNYYDENNVKNLI